MNHAFVEPGKCPHYVTPRSSLLVAFPCLHPLIWHRALVFNSCRTCFSFRFFISGGVRESPAADF